MTSKLIYRPEIQTSLPIRDLMLKYFSFTRGHFGPDLSLPFPRGQAALMHLSFLFLGITQSEFEGTVEILSFQPRGSRLRDPSSSTVTWPGT